ncbi:MAG TPA: LpqB family beta-propeller domain-containing protein [Marmoricola sp.]|jgi:hypothetical protein|nr:LpqB family beta-propeller domain-containing protein [Marmoricola sp.]
MTRLVAFAAGVLAALVLAAGCATLPDAGPVHTRRTAEGSPGEEAPYFAPPGPRSDDSPEEIVAGYLTAMQANPPSTAVARKFLTRVARDTWSPNQGTLVYDARTITDRGDRVLVRFSDVHRLDARGGWLGGPPGRTTTTAFRMVREDGEWRIANPPDALAVPASYFASLFVPFDLYFFDQTRSVLVPDRIYVPAGEQTATNLVRGLLLGPGRDLDRVTTTAFPSRTLLDLGVVVTDDGIAEIPLGTSVLKLSQVELGRALAQLAQTLQQVPGITRIRLTVDGAPVPLPGGRTDVSVSTGEDLDPGRAVRNPDPVAVHDGRVVRVVGDTTEPVPGPFGKRGYALRSVAADDSEGLIAAVTGNGHRVFVAGSAQGAPVRTAVTEAADLQRPVYDMFGTLWLLDRTARGARIILVEQRGTALHSRAVQVPGISGQALSAITVTADGTRLVATSASGADPVVMVSAVVRNDRGRVTDLLPARTVQMSGADLGPARDVGLSGPTTLALLTRPAGSSDRIVFVQIDGSPGGPEADPPDVVPSAAGELVVGPFLRMPLRVVTGDHHLLRLSDTGEWMRNKSGPVLAAAYPR